MILVAEKLHRFLPATESSNFSALPSSASSSSFAPSTSAEPLPQLVPMGRAIRRATPPHLRIPPICTGPPLAGMMDSPTSPRCEGPFSPEASEPSSPLPVSFGGFGSLHDEDIPDIPIPDLQGLEPATTASVAGSVASTGDVASDCGSDSFSWGNSSAGSVASADSSDAKAPPSSSSSSSSHAATKGGYRPVHVIRSSNGVATAVRAVQPASPPLPPQRLVIPLAPTGPLASPTMLSPTVMSQFLASAVNDRIVRCPPPAPASSAPCATPVDARGGAFKQVAVPAAAAFVPAPPVPAMATATVTAALTARQGVSGGVDVAAWASAAARAPQEQQHQVEMAAWRSLDEDMDTSAGAGGKTAATWEVSGWFRQMAGWQAVNAVDSSEEQLLPGRAGPQTSFAWSKPQRSEGW
ncbi:hypothetical protein CLOP_g697 [Closterium sp. NIES-67]|nr:hypothetical protein CLOP_g697 [Closterium sp. NIES-67]